jgi:hypothetical protein
MVTGSVPERRCYCCMLFLGNSPASEFYMPTFRSTLFNLHRRIVIFHTYSPMKMEKIVSKRRHIKFRRREITQQKAYSIQNTAKVWNQGRCFCFGRRAMAAAHKINNSKCGLPSTGPIKLYFDTCLWLNLWCRVHPEKLLVSQLVKKFPTHYRSTRACLKLAFLRAISFNSTPSHSISGKIHFKYYFSIYA